MKKTILIAIVIGFILASGFQLAADCADRSAGQCSYHGGVDKDTGKCKDGTAIGAVSVPKEKPDPAIAAKAKACKAATSAYTKLINNSQWKKALDQSDGTDSAVSSIMSVCSENVDDKYATKMAACKTEACKNKLQTTINKKYADCEALERWASSFEDLIDDAEAKKDATCN